MLYLVTLMIIVINFIYRDSKKVLILDFIYLLIMLGFSYGSYDTMIFINRYIDPGKFERFTEPLFNLIVVTLNKLNLSYRGFMICTALVELTMIFNFIKKYTSNHGYVIALFVIFPMFSVFEQLRFLMAFTIILRFGIDALIQKDKFYQIKYIITIIIATMIHSSSVFYLVFLIADYFSIKVLIRLTIIAVSLSLIIITNPMILNIIEPIVGEDKLEILTRIQKTQEGQFGCSALSLLIFGEYYWFYYYISKRQDKLDLSKEDMNYLTTVLKFNIISLISIPLIYMFSVAFMRIAVNLLLINYIGISLALKYEKKYCITKEKLQMFMTAFFLTVVMFFFSSHTRVAFRLNVIPFFEENKIIEILDIWGQDELY